MQAGFCSGYGKKAYKEKVSRAGCICAAGRIRHCLLSAKAPVSDTNTLFAWECVKRRVVFYSGLPSYGVFLEIEAKEGHISETGQA
jgi:hypothetical protein